MHRKNEQHIPYTNLVEQLPIGLHDAVLLPQRRDVGALYCWSPERDGQVSHQAQRPKSRMPQSESLVNRAMSCSVSTGRPRRAPMTFPQRPTDTHQLSSQVGIRCPRLLLWVAGSTVAREADILLDATPIHALQIWLQRICRFMCALMLPTQ